MCEESWEARLDRSVYFWATQGPSNSQKKIFFYIVPRIWNNLWLFFPLLYICLLFGPPNMKKINILGLNLKIPYQIASIFDMYIDMGVMIAGKQDRPSLIIEHPLRALQIAQNIHILFTFWLIYENCFSLLYICLHCDEVCICWHFGVSATPGLYVRAQHDPEKN